MSATWCAFQFRDELDLLEIKLATLSSVVDRFVIAESTVAHAGQGKPLIFLLHAERFQPWADRIKYLIDSAEYSGVQERERGQRAKLSEGIEAADDDLVMVSDLDELPNPAYWGALRAIAEDGGVAIPRLTMHVLGMRW